MVMNIFKKNKSLSETEEETERLQAENEKESVQLSIAQKRAAIAELKKRGLTAKHFSFDFSRIISWLKTH